MRAIGAVCRVLEIVESELEYEMKAGIFTDKYRLLIRHLVWFTCLETINKLWLSNGMEAMVEFDNKYSQPSRDKKQFWNRIEQKGEGEKGKRNKKWVGRARNNTRGACKNRRTAC